MPNQHTAYSSAETAWLRAHYATASQAEILAALPGRKWTSLQNYVCKIKASGRQHFIPKLPVTAWTPANVALLLAHYPAGGSAEVAALTGLTPNAVRSEASRRKLRYVAAAAPKRKLMLPKIKPPVRVPRVKINPAIVPLKRPDGQPLLAVKRSAGTPNLNVAKEARKRAEEAPRRAVAITADEVRKLPYTHAGRMAYMLNGVAGWQQWQQRQS